jgi:hypothetical protein
MHQMGSIAGTPESYMLLHSFAHALTRRLALEYGYTVASIGERIYALGPIDEDGPMAGVLLYTAAPDSEGTLGGLVSLGAPEVLGRHIAGALEAMRLCASDPLCASTHRSPSRGTRAASLKIDDQSITLKRGAEVLYSADDSHASDGEVLAVAHSERADMPLPHLPLLALVSCWRSMALAGRHGGTAYLLSRLQQHEEVVNELAVPLQSFGSFCCATERDVVHFGVEDEETGPWSDGGDKRPAQRSGR